MTDIVERLRIIEPDAPGSKSHCFRNPDGPEAADEIERLRKSLREIRDYEGSFPVMYDGDDAIAMKEIARAALEEKE